MLIGKMALHGALAAIVLGFGAQASQATLVPRTVLAEEFGWVI